MNEKEKLSVKPGAIIGRWTVLDEYQKTEKGERKWLCRCECGTERYVLERSLRHGGTLSCGCLRKEAARNAVSHDLTGQVFGALTVLGKAEHQRKNGGIWWQCQCECGAACEYPGTLLVTGRRTRCNSKAHEKNYAYVDISGQRFGRLVAQHRLKRESSDKSVIWHCICDCGNEVDVSYNTLVYSNQQSCGCKKKEHDQRLGKLQTRVDGTSLDIIKSKKVPTDNTTGYKGVYFIRGKYVAKIVFQKKAYYLGTYDNIEDAAEARKEAEEVLFDGVAEHYQKCDCGNIVFYSVNRLTRGSTLSCGCLYHDTRGFCSENRSDAVEGTLLSSLVSSMNPRSDNSSGHTGIYLDKRTGKWQAYINFQKKRYHLGMFKTKEQAIRARKSAEKKLFDPLIQEQWERLTKETQQKYLAYTEANEEIQDGLMKMKSENYMDSSFGEQR